MSAAKNRPTRVRHLPCRGCPAGWEVLAGPAHARPRRHPWPPTDVIRTVVRRVVPEVEITNQDPVDAAARAEVMYPHIQKWAEVCAEEADRFLIEGFELAPSYPVRLRAALGETEIPRV